MRGQSADLARPDARRHDRCAGVEWRRPEHGLATLEDRAHLLIVEVPRRRAPVLEARVGGIAPEHAGKPRDALVHALAAAVGGRVLIDAVGQGPQDAAHVGHSREILAREALRPPLERRPCGNPHHGGARETRIDELAGLEARPVGEAARDRLALGYGNDIDRCRSEIDEEGFGKARADEGGGGKKIGRADVSWMIARGLGIAEASCSHPEPGAGPELAHEALNESLDAGLAVREEVGELAGHRHAMTRGAGEKRRRLGERGVELVHSLPKRAGDLADGDRAARLGKRDLEVRPANVKSRRRRHCLISRGSPRV